ncbi:MAG: flagellar synthesis regulator FleN [Deltaproteobacteria bacterium HGW-Deltaproteobacteria-7]|nr:MAG: flagellar synthesis regulator FleN [Deltaproteobacteria bacterium HGW-Deltaproteobacteria-7]PKN20779.1 MAG: flagellar synthesis regulator FleN [Deltaproteobacteria bacterium HGW-Deltaproteobacteria-6]
MEVRSVMTVDQAATLREIKKKEIHPDNREGAPVKPGAYATRRHDTRVISVTSGKGGVGKTNITANLAYLLAGHKKRTLILDADAGLANIDVVLGINSPYNLYHVLNGEKTLTEAIIKGPRGIKILPSASGIPEMTDLSRGQKLTLIDELNTLNDSLDFMLIDTGAGISSNVMYFNMAAKEIIVVTTPEPTAMTDAYALIKVLYQRHAKRRFRMIVNMVHNAAEAKEIYTRLSNATDHFLNLTIEYLGHIVLDDKVRESVRKQTLVAELYPQCPAARCLAKISEKISAENLEEYENGSIKFFWESIIDKNRA